MKLGGKRAIIAVYRRVDVMDKNDVEKYWSEIEILL